MDSCRLEKVTSANLAEAAAVLTEAFRPDPYINYAAGSPKARAAWLPIVMEASAAVTMPDGETWILREGDAAAGVIGVTPPGRYPWPLPRTLSFIARMALRPNPWTPPFVGMLRRGLPYLAAWDRLHMKEPHWYVYIIGVHPDHQGRGHSRRLMQPILDRAEADGVPVYLETQTEGNVAIYRGMGFELIERADMDGPSIWSMARRPPGQGEKEPGQP